MATYPPLQGRQIARHWLEAVPGQGTLIDLDEVCVSNVNRQLHAINDAVGRAKVEVMAERVRGINPECDVHAVTEFFTEANARELLAKRLDLSRFMREDNQGNGRPAQVTVRKGPAKELEIEA